jgi:hypothetical protein
LYNTDIQLIQLDRHVGLLAGYLEMNPVTSASSTITMVGYPSDPALESYLPTATLSMLIRTATAATPSSIASSSRLTAVSELWAWAGESGSPYWRLSTAGVPSVMAVHIGGETGCMEYGCQVPLGWTSLVKGNASWPNTVDHCQIMELHADLRSQYDRQALKGSVLEQGATSGEASLTVTGTVVNMGTLNASHIQISLVQACTWSLSSGFLDATTLERQAGVLSPRGTWRLEHKLARTALKPCGGTIYLGWTWQAEGCLHDEPQWLLASIVTDMDSRSSLQLPLVFALVAGVGLLVACLAWVLTRAHHAPQESGLNSTLCDDYIISTVTISSGDLHSSIDSVPLTGLHDYSDKYV